MSRAAPPPRAMCAISATTIARPRRPMEERSRAMRSPVIPDHAQKGARGGPCADRRQPDADGPRAPQLERDEAHRHGADRGEEPEGRPNLARPPPPRVNFKAL